MPEAEFTSRYNPFSYDDASDAENIDDLCRAKEFCEIARLDGELFDYKSPTYYLESQAYHLELALAVYRGTAYNAPEINARCLTILHDLSTIYDKLGRYEDQAECSMEYSVIFSKFKI